MKIEILASQIKVSEGANVLELALVREGEALIISLDDANHWRGAAGGEITLPQLQAIAAAIEAEADRLGVELEFD